MSLMLLQIAALGAAAGFGVRLGWELLPVAEAAVAHAMAFPIWLCQLAVFHARRFVRRP